MATLEKKMIFGSPLILLFLYNSFHFAPHPFFALLSFFFFCVSSIKDTHTKKKAKTQWGKETNLWSHAVAAHICAWCIFSPSSFFFHIVSVKWICSLLVLFSRNNSKKNQMTKNSWLLIIARFSFWFLSLLFLFVVVCLVLFFFFSDEEIKQKILLWTERKLFLLVLWRAQCFVVVVVDANVSEYCRMNGSDCVFVCFDFRSVCVC